MDAGYVTRYEGFKIRVASVSKSEAVLIVTEIPAAEQKRPVCGPCGDVGRFGFTGCAGFLVMGIMAAMTLSAIGDLWVMSVLSGKNKREHQRTR